MAYNAADLFEPGTAILTAAGKGHLGAVVSWLKGQKDDRAEVVVAARHDPADKDQSGASAAELTRKRAEAGVEFLKAAGDESPFDGTPVAPVRADAGEVLLLLRFRHRGCVEVRSHLGAGFGCRAHPPSGRGDGKTVFGPEFGFDEFDALSGSDDGRLGADPTLRDRPEHVDGQPADAHRLVFADVFDGMIEAPNEVLALAKHVERLEAAIQGQSREKELKLLRKLVGDKKAHKALETRVAAQQAEMAEQARRLAAKEAEVRRLRDRLEQQPSWGCEKHDVELRRLTQKLNKLKGLSLELTGHIDEGSDALRKCGEAMKEHLRRI